MSEGIKSDKLIDFRNVSVSFRQKKKTITAVRDVSFSIKEGEIIGIIGSSGAGKSTLLRTINRLQATSEGIVTVEDKIIKDLTEKELRELRSNIGMIFQHFNLIGSKDVYSNIEFVLLENGKSKAEAKERIDELLKYVGIEDKKHAYPAQLSGGQKQRVAIARALANNARILLCDEPTSALDLETTEAVLNLLKQINRELKITIVLITHELDVVKEICDRVVVMDEGRVVEIGEVYDVFTKPVSEFTKNLIQKENKFVIPSSVLENADGKIVRIDYFDENAERALIAEAIEEFGVKINILHGRIEYIKKKPVGVLYISVNGEPAQTREALKFIRESAGKTEVLRDA
jgi:D-methionine transport system ATP-binding protein